MTDASTTGAVERFRLSYGNLLQSPSGPYVRFTDYQAAIQRAEAAEAQAARAWEAGRDAAKLRASMFGQGKQGMRTSEVIQRQIRALTPPADLSAALTARLDAEWNAAIEAATSAMDTHYADKACGMIGSHWLTRLRALRRAAPTEGEAQLLDDTTRAVLDRAERIVAGQSQQEQRTAEIFLRPTEGEA